MPRKVLPQKQANVDTGHQILFSNACRLKGWEGPASWVQCANMWQDCSLTAVQRKSSNDGLNLRCLDQCHGVRSHGTSSSQGRRKLVVQSSINTWVYILVFAESNFCRSTSVFFCGCASNGQDSPKASPRVIFSWKNFIEQLNLIAQMNADWKVEGLVCWVQRAKMWQDCSLTAVQRKTTLVEQSWFMMAWT